MYRGLQAKQTVEPPNRNSATCANTKSFDVEPPIHTYASTCIRTAKTAPEPMLPYLLVVCMYVVVGTRDHHATCWTSKTLTVNPNSQSRAEFA